MFFEVIMRQVLSSCSASISELKKNPTALLAEAEGAPIAILNHNIPTAYLIPAETYEWLLEKLEDSELAQIVKERAGEKKYAIEVNLSEL
ncbi:antitoxin StbD [Bathymodiolus platifrons methanotrophic gill symbiont]|nr:antitoxin StbD [Bathymodiolus platifrons methanotrophic gill symbiont]